MTKKIIKEEEEWKKILTPEEYYVTRQKGTERAFTGKYYKSKEKGIYKCICCSTDLFSSETKFDSKTGWPSFYAPVKNENIELITDDSLPVERTEVICARCNAHLGHIFSDGPQPTGSRYCINSASLKLNKDKE